MGTFESGRYAHDIAPAIESAAKMGYRLFDCALVYGNEDKIGVLIHNYADWKATH